MGTQSNRHQSLTIPSVLQSFGHTHPLLPPLVACDEGFGYYSSILPDSTEMREENQWKKYYNIQLMYKYKEKWDVRLQLDLKAHWTTCWPVYIDTSCQQVVIPRSWLQLQWPVGSPEEPACFQNARLRLTAGFGERAFAHLQETKLLHTDRVVLRCPFGFTNTVYRHHSS